jgi:hypothetical protein
MILLVLLHGRCICTQPTAQTSAPDDTGTIGLFVTLCLLATLFGALYFVVRLTLRYLCLSEIKSGHIRDAIRRGPGGKE